MNWKKIIYVVLISVFVIGLEGCKKGPSSSTKNNKKIKKGKPIPCPIKDC